MRKPVARRTLGVSGAVSLFILLVYLLSLGSTVWATPGQDVLRQTLPPLDKPPIDRFEMVSEGEAATASENLTFVNPITGEEDRLPVAFALPDKAVESLVKETGAPVEIEVRVIRDKFPEPPPLDEQPLLFLRINVIAGGEVRPGAVLDKPLRMVFQVPQDIFEAVRGNLSEVRVRRFDEGTMRWVELPHLEEDIANRTVTVEARSFSVFALTVPRAAVEAVQPTPTPTPTPVPPPTGDIQPSAGLLTALAVLGFLMVLTGGYLIRRRTT